ncbi:MAG: hypothetical protein MJ069_05570 [Salinivirgaceae bacterium]|nr:hypothetical protein [Salinivirgaceae bacterium]
MQTIGWKLRLKVLLLALVLPVVCGVAVWNLRLYNGNDVPSWRVAAMGVALGVLLDVVCYFPKLFSIFFYWALAPFFTTFITVAIASLFFPPIGVLLIGTAGFVVGVLIDWSLLAGSPFFTVNKWILGIIYVYVSVFLMGLAMGLPFANVFLGIVAGNYVSFRYLSPGLTKKRAYAASTQVAIFTSVTLLVIQAIGILLMFSDLANISDYLFSISGIMLKPNFLFWGFIVVGLLLAVLQYFVTLGSAKIMYQYRFAKRELAAKKSV